jgi:excisionase family DNA binding protein
VTRRSGRRRWQQVVDARQQARATLGHGPEGGDLYGPPKRRTPHAPPPMPASATERPPERPDESQRVLSLGEAASRLGMSRSELEAMIAAGKVEALPTGFTRMIPTREVERLRKGQYPGAP